MKSTFRSSLLIVGTMAAITACSSSPTASPSTPSTPSASSPTTAAARNATASPPTNNTTATSAAPSSSEATTTVASASLGEPTQCPLGALDAATGTTNITYWHEHGTLSGDVMRSLVARFNEENPKIHVMAEFQGDLINKYETNLAGGTQPDVVSLQSSHTQEMIDTKSTVPYGACVVADHDDLSDELPPVMALGMTGDTMVALPWGQGGQVLFYNKAAFVEAGLDPDNPPTTYDELRAASEAIMASGAAKHGVAMTIGGGNLPDLFGMLNQAWGVQPDGAGRATHVDGDSDLAVSVATTLQEMATSGELLPFAPGPNPDALLSVATGDAAMAVSAAGNLGEVVAALDGGVGAAVGLTVDQLGVGPLPSLTQRKSSYYTWAGKTIWLVDNGDAAKLEAAYRFMKWLNEPEQIAEWSMKTGFIVTCTKAAALPAMQDYWAANPLFKVAYDQAAIAPYVPNPSARIGPNDEAFAPFDIALPSIVIDGADVVTTLGDATRKADAVLADYNERFPAG